MINVIKRNGTTEPLDINKITKSLQWASEGEDTSELELACNLHFYDGIQTKEILDITILTAKNLTSMKNLKYDAITRNLLRQKVYSEAFEGKHHYSLLEAIQNNVDKGYYKKTLLPQNNGVYSIEDYNDLNNIVDMSRDKLFSAAGLEQLIDKYMFSDRNNCLIEAPQHMFMAIAMDAAMLSSNPLQYAKEYYEALSTFKVSLPTPMMKALRTESNDYASCVALNIGDSIDSWCEGKAAIIKHTVASAGIGVDISSVASINDIVKNGTIKHPGKIPVMRAIDSDIQMSSQNGRRGQAVVHTNFFDPEIIQILAIKSPRTEVVKRINDLKHVIKFNSLFYDRVKEGKDITLMSTRQFPSLLPLFNSADTMDEFKAEYEKIEEANPNLVRINARELAETFITERTETGIYYVLNIDNVNKNSAYSVPITQTNICVEFLSPTKPVTAKYRNRPDIGICILANINQGLVGISELPHYTKLLVTLLNDNMHRQNHPTPQANAFVKNYASLGIGFSNHAYFLAKQGLKFGTEGALAHAKWVEHFQYGLIKASAEYAGVYGKAPLFNHSTYAKGIMPLDRHINALGYIPECNWEALKVVVAQNGMANCSLSMVPPSETSSVIGNQTSGMEPIRDLETVKTSKTAVLKQYAPNAYNLALQYDLAFERNITADFLLHVAATQMWIDGSISANTFYNPELFPDKKIPMKVLLQDFFNAYKLGIKTLYYQNTYVIDNTAEQHGCASGGCSV